MVHSYYPPKNMREKWSHYMQCYRCLREQGLISLLNLSGIAWRLLQMWVWTVCSGECRSSSVWCKRRERGWGIRRLGSGPRTCIMLYITLKKSPSFLEPQSSSVKWEVGLGDIKEPSYSKLKEAHLGPLRRWGPALKSYWIGKPKLSISYRIPFFFFCILHYCDSRHSE